MNEHAGALDGRNMNESVRLAVIAADEAEALHGVEEFDGALGLLAGQLALRAAVFAITAAEAAFGPRRAHDFHRLAIDLDVGRGNAAAAIDERELERLTIGQIGKAGLLDSADVDEHVLAAVIADDEAEALLGIEEFDDAFAFANDLGRHAAAETTAAASTTATEATAAAAVAATAATSAVAEATTAAAAVAAARRATVAEATAATAAIGTVAPAERAFSAEAVVPETVPFVPAATATVAFTPSIETHARLNSLRARLLQ